MKSRYPPFTYTGVSNEKLVMVFNLTILPSGDLSTYSSFMVYHMDPELVSNNYTTKTVGQTPHLTFLSRNSPCVLEGGRVYLHGAFPEFNLKPSVFRTEHLLSWVDGFPQIEPCMQALSKELLLFDTWLMAHKFETGTIQ